MSAPLDLQNRAHVASFSHSPINALVITSLVVALFSCLMLASQITTDLGFVTDLTQITAKMFGLDGITFSIGLFGLYFSGIVGYAFIKFARHKHTSLPTSQKVKDTLKAPQEPFIDFHESLPPCLIISIDSMDTPHAPFPIECPSQPLENILKSAQESPGISLPQALLPSDSTTQLDSSDILCPQLPLTCSYQPSENILKSAQESLSPPSQLDSIVVLRPQPIECPSQPADSLQQALPPSDSTTRLPRFDALRPKSPMMSTSSSKKRRSRLSKPAVSASPASPEICQLDDDHLMMIPKDIVTRLPKGNLRDYVTRTSRDYLPYYQELVEKGKLFVKMFKDTEKGDPNSPENTITDRAARRSYASAFVWHLMSTAEGRSGKAFEEGMFVLQDNDWRIHDFFALVGSERASSHYKTSRLSSFGIDVPQDYRTGLPAGHQTMHFGKLRCPDTGGYLTFVKPESWGTESLSQIIGHGVSFIFSRIPHLLGYASQEGQYKEHFAKEDRDFTKLLEKIAPKDLANPIRSFGIAGFVHYLCNLLKTHQVQLQVGTIDPKTFKNTKQLIKEFVDKHGLKEREGIGAVHGSEVVIADRQSMERLHGPMHELLTLLN